MGKGGRCVRLTTLLQSCAVVTKSGNLNFLEPSGPLQACNGTDLPLPLEKEARMLTQCTMTLNTVIMSKLNHTKTAQKTGTASEGSVPPDIRQTGSTGRVS